MWDLLPNDEERLITASVREYLEREWPLARLRPKASPRDPRSARAGMVDLGLLGVGLPESVGGSGLGLVAEMLVQRELGRHLISPSVLASVLAAHVALHAGDTGLASAMVSSNASAALGVLGPAHMHAESAQVLVLDLSDNDTILLWNDQGMGLFAADALSQVRPDECLDESVSMHLGLVRLDRARHWIPPSQAFLAMRAQVLLAAASIGLAEHACDITVEYAKMREQFGKPIGSFQAVKHCCADMALRWRLGWYQTSLACLKVQVGAPDAPLHAAAAKLLAAQAAHRNGRAAIQMHGGIGFQSECDVHWLVKRAHLYDQAGGSMPLQARRVIAEPSPLW